MAEQVVINWALSSLTGYGIHGLYLLMQHIRRGGRYFTLTDGVIPPVILPPPFDQTLAPLLEPAAEAGRRLAADPGLNLVFEAPVLHGVGNNFAGFRHWNRVRGRPDVACAALEQMHSTPEWVEHLRRYDMFIAFSRWNADFLRGLGLDNVHLCHQGADTNLFFPQPAPRQDGRFVIFSGGKFEFRKGQDIVVAAFRRFVADHPEAKLIVAWQSMAEVDAAPFAAAGLCRSVPQRAASGPGLEIGAWLEREGLPPGSFIALPWVTSADLARMHGFCDMAVFPNRCEGGTNFVAMECLASGVPTYVSANTGHLDLIDLVGCEALRAQSPVPPQASFLSTEGWGQTDVDEVVAAMEAVYANPAAARQKAAVTAAAMKAWDWGLQNEKMLAVIDAAAG